MAEHDPLEGLPPDLAELLRDQRIIVFEKIAEWANAPSDTPSAMDLSKWDHAKWLQDRLGQARQQLAEAVDLVEALIAYSQVNESDASKRSVAQSPQELAGEPPVVRGGGRPAGTDAPSGTASV